MIELIRQIKASSHRAIAAFSLLTLSACGGEMMPSENVGAKGNIETAAGKSLDLSAVFDCVRENDAVLIAAHRGGPAPGYPENALETLKRTFAQGVPVLEVDVSVSRDGVLFLFHDRTLGRLMQMRGTVADTDWSKLSGWELHDNDGEPTGYYAPRLEDVLAWAVESGAILELDRKDNVAFADMVEAVRAARAENNVILITYNDEEAERVAAIAPDLMLTASARSARDLDDLERRGVDLTRLIAWAGTSNPSGPDYVDMEADGVEAAFGTLGRPGERLDDSYRARDYRELVDMGVRLIATDRPGDVAEFLTEDDTAIAACLTR